MANFPPALKKKILLKSRRLCAVCREFAGREIAIHHIIPQSEGGSGDEENAIPLCNRCHSDAGHYNAKHPIGTKYSPTELRSTRDRFFEQIENNPYIQFPNEPTQINPSTFNIGNIDARAVAEIVVLNVTATPSRNVTLNIEPIMGNVRADLIKYAMQPLEQDLTLSMNGGGSIKSAGMLMSHYCPVSGKSAVSINLRTLLPHSPRILKCGYSFKQHPEAIGSFGVKEYDSGDEEEFQSAFELKNGVAMGIRATSDIPSSGVLPLAAVWTWD